MSSPKISVIVPIKDVAPYLPACLDSLRSQSLSEAEFILVEDKGTDQSLEICENYCQQDARFRLVKHEVNKGLLAARLSGVDVAEGEFTLFLDGDDSLCDKEALTDLYAQAKDAAAKGYEAVRFGVVAMRDGKVEPCTTALMQKLGHPTQDPIDNLRQLYVDHERHWGVVMNIFTTVLLKRVALHMKREWLVMGEDAYFSFLIAYFARGYQPLQTRPLYNYRLASGVSTSAVTPGVMRHYLLATQVPTWLQSFLEEVDAKQVYFEMLVTLRAALCQHFADAMARIPCTAQERTHYFAEGAKHYGYEPLFLALQSSLRYPPLEVTNKELYALPAGRLFRAFIKSLLGLRKRGDSYH